jgi:xylose dehydrogenase (NAD/NADP)
LDKVRWGILGVAGIAKRALIPGIKQSESGVVAAIASRDEVKAKQAAEELDIQKSYGSYEALLADPDIDAIYIPWKHKKWSRSATKRA